MMKDRNIPNYKRKATFLLAFLIVCNGQMAGTAFDGRAEGAEVIAIEQRDGENTPEPIPASTPAPTPAPTEAPTPEPVQTPAKEPNLADGQEEISRALEPAKVSELTQAAMPEPAAAPELTATPEPAATPTVEPTATTEATAAPEPTAASTEEPTATTEPTAAPTEESTATPEPTAAPTVEPTATPEPLTLSTPEGDNRILVGEAAGWTFHSTGAHQIRYEILNTEGRTVASGNLAPDAAAISWMADVSGVYRLILTASNDDEKICTEYTFAVSDGEINAVLSTDGRYCFAGDVLTIHLSAQGGAAPLKATATVKQGDAVLCEDAEIKDGNLQIQTAASPTASVLTVNVILQDASGESRTLYLELPCPSAERESSSDWKRSVSGVRMGEDWAENLVAIARSQIGYQESRENFIIDDEGKQQGYTRYGDWYGAAYGEWCAMYMSFCLEYAKIPESYFPQDANCARWIQKLNGSGLYIDADAKGEDGETYVPVPGDIVFFDWADGEGRDGRADHAGIVASVSGDTVKTIEGNSGKQVRTREYSLRDREIMGYGRVSLAQERYIADHAPAATPSPEPTDTPAEEPTAEPTEIPTEESTAEPTAAPEATPEADMMFEPTSEPADTPEGEETLEPEGEPLALATPVDAPIWRGTEEPLLILAAANQEAAYQWEKAPLQSDDWVDLEGETQMQLALAPTIESLSMQYRCRISTEQETILTEPVALVEEGVQTWIVNGEVTTQKELEAALHWNSTDILVMDMDASALRHLQSREIAAYIDEEGYLIDSAYQVVLGWLDRSTGRIYEDKPVESSVPEAAGDADAADDETLGGAN